jgi:hypothetical protein
MGRSGWKLALAFVALLGGCSRRGKNEVVPVSVDSATDVSSVASGPTRVVETPAIFSLPIAATRGGGATFVAGFVASESVVRVMAFRDAKTLWTADAVHAATWTPDAQLSLEPAADGVAILWRSARGESSAGSMVLLGGHGEAKGGPDDVGASMCTTATGLAWIGADRHGPSRVFARAWGEAAPRMVASVAAERAPTLTCGTRGAFVLGDGDDDITATSFVPGESPSNTVAVVLRDADFGDDEREHYAFSSGDDLVLVRVGESGDVAVRRIRPDGGPGPWRKWKHSIGSDDDVVEVDGNGESTVLVVASQAGAVCPSTGTPADRLRAVRFDSSEHESSVDLSAPDCDRTPGPVWIGDDPGVGLLVAWGQGTARPKSAAAPLSGLAFRATASALSGELAIDALGLTKAGCDDDGCFAAALERARDGDAMHPLAIAILRYVARAAH